MKKFSLLILTMAALSSKCAHAMEDSIKDAFLKQAAVYKKNIELRASSSSSSSSSSSAATTTLPQAPQDLVDVRYSSASASSSSSSSSCNTKQSASSASTSTNSCTPTPFYASLGIDEFRKANIAYEQARNDRKQQLEDNDNPYALEKNFTQEELLTLAKIEAHNNPTSPQATEIDQKQSAEGMQIDPNEVQTIANAIINAPNNFCATMAHLQAHTVPKHGYDHTRELLYRGIDLAAQTMAPIIAQELLATGNCEKIKKEYGQALLMPELQTEVTKQVAPALFTALLTHIPKLLEKHIISSSADTNPHSFKFQGTRIAYSECNEQGYAIKIYDLKKKQSTTIAQSTSLLLEHSFNHQGTHIAYSEYNRRQGYAIKIYDLNTKQSTTIAQDASPLLEPSFNHQGTHIAYRECNEQGYAIKICDLNTNESTTIVQTLSLLWNPAFNHQGTHIAYSECNRREGYAIKICDLNTKQSTTIANTSKFSFNHQGTHIAYSEYNHRQGYAIKIYDLNTKQSTTIAQNISSFSTPSFNHQGTHIASIERNGQGYAIKIHDLKKKQSTTIAQNISPFFEPIFNPQGTGITYVKKNVILMVNLPQLSIDEIIFLQELAKVKKQENSSQKIARAQELLASPIVRAFDPEMREKINEQIAIIQQETTIELQRVALEEKRKQQCEVRNTRIAKITYGIKTISFFTILAGAALVYAKKPAPALASFFSGIAGWLSAHFFANKIVN